MKCVIVGTDKLGAAPRILFEKIGVKYVVARHMEIHTILRPGVQVVRYKV